MHELLTQLERHRHRRGAGTPTVSVLAGNLAQALALVEGAGSRVEPISATELEEVATDWVRHAAAMHDLLKAGARFLARRIERDVDELHQELLRKSEHELAHFLQVHAPAWSDEPETLAFRWCVLARSREHLRQPLQLIRGCAALLAPENPPGLVLASQDPDRRWITEAAETASVIAEAVPALPVVIAAPESLVESFLLDNHGRAGILVREGLIRAA